MGTDPQLYELVTVRSGSPEIASRSFSRVENAVWAYWHQAVLPGVSVSLVAPDGRQIAVAGDDLA